VTAPVGARPAPRRALATVIGVCPSTLTRWAAAGRIPAAVAVRLPSGRWRYDLDAAADWVADLLTEKETTHADP